MSEQAVPEPAGAPPSVSVIVPTRDRPEFLRIALESILTQTYEGEIECLVVFDRTAPDLPEIEVPERRTLRALVNERSPGLAGGRNTGALAATGRLVAFCDDDDRWRPEKLARQVDTMHRHGATTVSSGIAVHYDGRVVERLPETEIVTFDDLLRSRRMEIHPSTYVVDREALLGPIGLVDEGIPGSYAEDYEWLLRAARAGVVAATPAVLAEIEWHASSFFTARWDTIISALGYLLRRYPEFEQQPAGMARILGQMAFAHAAAGRAPEARSFVGRTLRRNALEPRAYLALLVASGVVSADAVRTTLHRFGRGI